MIIVCKDSKKSVAGDHARRAKIPDWFYDSSFYSLNLTFNDNFSENSEFLTQSECFEHCFRYKELSCSFLSRGTDRERVNRCRYKAKRDVLRTQYCFSGRYLTCFCSYKVFYVDNKQCIRLSDSNLIGTTAETMSLTTF